MALIIISYIILSLIAGVYGSRRKLGFWGFFVAAIVTTPILVLLFLAITKEKTEHKQT